ncbi:hypothetical protein [Haloferax mucosum]|uniref:hypothetical protein n=1 Tax=Haloferax mucosum TaxID=403181 RepID=UPI0003231994|nr:hypothetical protein [Haloferax mucosum]
MSPDATERETFEVSKDATIEKVTTRFYRGPQLDLSIRPFVESEEGRERDIVDVIGRDGVVGDNDVFPFHVSEPVERGDVVGIEVTNADGTNTYDYNVDLELDRAGGVSRLLPSILQRWL